MTRAERLLRNFFVAAVLYIGVFLGYIPAPKSLEEIWLYVPFLVVVSFGLWCLYTLVYGVLTFQDKEADFKELVKEIETAKADLRTKGVTVD
ncbi:dolichol-phosphate mannosyltransferase subunit 3-like protein [Saitoella complicata NRRL Y-17804]|nr:dolichol-phosphate mannosyltransferase subunit 3-like protein [Saitoella complicata NRRL Y-17804]ODQ50089.1 dolichol-phosphate mannosyltransferase subunit 3-like protein [Saitoella complicata NRRL Y-17804]